MPGIHASSTLTGLMKAQSADVANAALRTQGLAIATSAGNTSIRPVNLTTLSVY